MDIKKDILCAAIIALIISAALTSVASFFPGSFRVPGIEANIGSGISDFMKGVGSKIVPENWFAEKPELSAPLSADKNSFLGVASPYEARLEYEEAIIKTVENASPSVVSIAISKNIPVIERCPINPFGDNSGIQFYVPCQSPSGKTEKKDIGGGTGFIVGSDGMIVTNKHVVSDKKADYMIITQDGKKYPGKIIAFDEGQDIAILKIEASDLPTLRLGDSDSVRLAQTAIAIGNALGEYKNTVSVGVISGKGRTVTASGPSGAEETIEGVFQTDAAINPGNSGGPLLNLKGEVIGINTAIASGAENIGFAIPSNKARRALETYSKTGKIEAPYLGVWYEKTEEGAKIGGNSSGPSVTAGSPAEKAGIRTGDIITEADGKALNDEVALSSVIADHAPGDTLHLKIKRGEDILTKDVILDAKK